jgi:hypothetical protein
VVLFVFIGVARRMDVEGSEEPKRSGEGDNLDCVGVEEGVSMKLNSQLNGSSGDDGRATTLAQDIFEMLTNEKECNCLLFGSGRVSRGF